MQREPINVAREMKCAKSLFGALSRLTMDALKMLVAEHRLSVSNGDIIYVGNGWYVSHAGLLRLAAHRRCFGIHTHPVLASSDPTQHRWVFKATVFKSRTCKGFVGYGDADPSNVSERVRGAEMRVAETRAVNRALRKAYGIGICSVEEIGSSDQSPFYREAAKVPPQPSNGRNGNYSSPKLRDRLCVIIRQHQLDPTLVKSYATEFCGVKSLREASREQVENFVGHLADWAEKDRDALLCHLNNYLSSKEGAA